MASHQSIHKPKIVVMGGINMDVVATVDRMPERGETVHGDRFFMAGGGKGANQAVAAARLGADVRMIGRVGDDDFGRTLVDRMRSEGIDMQGVSTDASNTTGVAVIMVDASGQNIIAEVYGANRASDETQLDAAKRAMEDADTLMLQLETPPDISLEAAKYARSHGVRVVWDPAPAAEMPDEGFEFAVFLTPNETEAAELTGIVVTDVDTARAAADALLSSGVGAAIVKMGKRAARRYRDARKAYLERGDHDALEAGRALLSAQRNLSIDDRQRLFGYLEGGGRTILPETRVLLTETPTVPGLDGEKMSKSYNNAIDLREDPNEVDRKIRTMPTDPARVRRHDPGNPANCPVFALHKLLSDESVRNWADAGCRSAGIGCIDCKRPLIDAINAELAPIRERAEQFEHDEELVKSIIVEGSETARDVARETMEDVRAAVGVNYR